MENVYLMKLWLLKFILSILLKIIRISLNYFCILISIILYRLAHLCTNQIDNKQEQPCLGFNAEQLEECDLEGKDNLLLRIDLVEQTNTHLAMLGTSNHVLYTYKTKNGQAICLRHNNDGFLWITDQVNDNKWNIKHYYTFPGFGYVEASKSNKKFCVSPTGKYLKF